jgi:hypothetical protein
MSQRDKPRLALNNITAGACEREDANRTREAGHLDEIQGVVVNTLNLFRIGASLLANFFGVGFIVWLGVSESIVCLTTSRRTAGTRRQRWPRR